MMFICKICGYKCKRGAGHIKPKHNISSLEYIKQYENVNIIELYQQGLSAVQICSLIREKNLGLNPIKSDIYVYLRENNIVVRETSEAIKIWNNKRGGPWNKGLTKKQHPSIMSYAISREGENNGYYTGTEESRNKTKWWKYKQNKEIQDIRKKTGNTLKKLYREGKLVAYSKKNPLWAEENLRKRQEGYLKWLESGNKNKFGNSSLAEKEIATILEELNIKYIKQATIAKKYHCDFLLPEYSIVIEYYGTYWHCDPRKYDCSFYNAKKDKTAQEIWDYDLQRQTAIKDQGYTFIVIWETDYKILDTTERKKFVYEALESKVGSKTTK